MQLYKSGMLLLPRATVLNLNLKVEYLLSHINWHVTLDRLYHEIYIVMKTREQLTLGYIG